MWPFTCTSLSAPTIASSNRWRWWIAFTVLLVAMLEVLDMTIVTVSLPDMMGAMGVNVDQVAWILTSYAVSAAIMMPLTGLLIARVGCRRLLLISILGFMVSSILCGAAQSFSMMLLCRIAQGLFGASLVPISQYVLMELFPGKALAKAMAVWSIGIACAPILGPVLGGYITTYLSWRWIFYINVPICLIAYAMSIALIHESKIIAKKIDGWGLALMVVGVAALQLCIDRGNALNWFESTTICWFVIIFSTTLAAFLCRCWCIPHAIVNLRIFKDRNFLLSTLLIMTFSLPVFGQIAQSPLMLETLFHYSPYTAGVLMIPRLLGGIVAVIIVGPFTTRIDLRVFLWAGLGVTILGTFLFSRMSMQFNETAFIVASLIQGMGIGLFFFPLGTLSYATLSEQDTADAVGLSSFCRNLSLALGVSLMVSLLTRNQQSHWHALVSHLNLFNPAVQTWLQPANPAINASLTIAKLAHIIYQQAAIIAFNSMAWFAACALLALFPLVALMKKVTLGSHGD